MERNHEVLQEMEKSLKTALKKSEELNSEISNREFSLMRTKLQEALMWFEKGLKESL